MTGDAVRVEGAQRVALTLAVAMDKIGDLAPREVGNYIRDHARSSAPWVSGRLRASLDSETADGRVSVGSDLVYAPVINFGWSGHNIAAQPFLIPNAEDMEPAWGRVYVTDTRQILKTTVKGA